MPKTDSLGPVSIVKSDSDAWKILSRWVDHDEEFQIDFRGWPVLRLTIRGDDYDSSLNSGQMAALLEFKQTIGRTYAMVAHGAYDMRRLSTDESDDLEFSTQVRQGSSIMETDLTPIVAALANAMSGSPTATLMVGLVLGLSIVSAPVIKKYLEIRLKQLEADERKQLAMAAMSHGEERLLALLDRAIEKLSERFPQVAQAVPDARGAIWKLAAASADADQMTVAGIDLDRQDLEALAGRRKPRRSVGKRMRRRFAVLGVKRADNGYTVNLEAVDLVLVADYRLPEMTDEQVAELFSCVQSRGSIDAAVDIRTIEGARVSARLLQFKIAK